MDGFSLSGGSLTRPIQAGKVVWTPEDRADGTVHGLVTTVSLPAGDTSPIAVAAHLSLDGYEINARGPIALSRLQELAHVVSAGNAPELSGISGASAAIDLTAQGKWLPSQSPLRDTAGSRPGSDSSDVFSVSNSDQISGTMSLHDAKWRSGALANDLDIDEATFNFGPNQFDWNPIVFRYGPVRGTASLDAFPDCEGDECAPRLTLQFTELDAAALQAALLGARKQDSAF